MYGLVAMLCLWASSWAQTNPQPFRGTVRSAVQQSPLSGASITVSGSRLATVTNEQGQFSFSQLPPGALLLVTAVGYRPQELTVTLQDSLQILMEPLVAELDGAIVIAYGKTSRRMSTGSIGRVDAAIIQKQPVTNVLSALQGRVAGLWIEQTNGLPGSNFNVEIRGRQSIGAGTRPFYIVDGVPWMQNTTVTTLATGLSPNPFNTLNPNDIESVEVLKDADATAIYGSQAANGVILITTKKGEPGATRFIWNAFGGGGKVTGLVEQLPTATYLAMRKQAFKNDGIQPTNANAPDLTIWDSSRYTNWANKLAGGTAQLWNLQGSLRGGNRQTQLLLSGNYQQQTTVFPQSKPSTRGSGMLSVTHRSSNDRLGASVQTSYGVFRIQTPVFDLANFMYLPPNAPEVYDSAGKLNWTNWTGADNPMAQLQRIFEHRTATLNTNILLDYKLLPGLLLKTNIGYNDANTEEYRASPISSKRPAAGVTAEADFLQSSQRNWIVEPYAVYSHRGSQWKAELTAGASVQQRLYNMTTISGTQYTNDALLRNAAAAGQTQISTGFSQYRYYAWFGRLSTQWKNRYVVNFNGRNDVSSRFGPANRSAWFGSVGAAWILSEEPWMKGLQKRLPFVKLRGSFGSTGNDQIGDYAFLDAWGIPFSGRYQGNLSIAPNSLFNPYLQWERNNKLEAALELGVLNNTWFVTVAYYQIRSDNQLTGYPLPTQTGFGSIADNLDARIENSGWEIESRANLFSSKTFGWSATFNLSIPQSKLLSYPGLEQTLNRFTYKVGSPLDTRFGYVYTGVDAASGVYQFADQNGDGRISSSNDYVPIGRLGRKYFGGLDNLLSWKGFELDIFFQFVNQTSRAYFGSMPVVPGSLGNQPLWVGSGAWSASGETSELQKYTTRSGVPATAYRNLQNSSAAIVDASFIRLKNVSLAYELPAGWKKKMKLQEARLYVQAQNSWAWSNYLGGDPETTNLRTLPPLKMITGGIQITL
jgi:TonB-linked SusC/RagA family outer membrane protein